MRKQISCCYNCPDRVLHCHSECEKYLSEREEYLKQKAEVMKKHGMESQITNAIREGGERMKTKKKSKKL